MIMVAAGVGLDRETHSGDTSDWMEAVAVYRVPSPPPLETTSPQWIGKEEHAHTQQPQDLSQQQHPNDTHSVEIEAKASSYIIVPLAAFATIVLEFLHRGHGRFSSLR